MAKRSRPVGHTHQPQTEAAIEAMDLPPLPEALARVLRGCEAFPEARLIGWDVIMTNDGFRVVEVTFPGNRGLAGSATAAQESTECPFLRPAWVSGLS